MKISRVITLSLGLAIVVFALGYANPAFAGKSDKTCPGHPSCKDDDGGGDPTPIVYTVKLSGAFAFERDMILNSKANQLKSDSPVEIDRPLDTDRFLAVWNDVFKECPHFFVGPTPVEVPGFTAPDGRKGWRIDKAGGVRVNFGDIPFSQEDFAGFLIPDSAWVNLALIGDIPFQVPFPIVDDPIELKYFQIYGQTESGVTPRLACDDKNFETEDLLEPIFLTITAK
jgi:hypothetical protein